MKKILPMILISLSLYASPENIFTIEKGNEERDLERITNQAETWKEEMKADNLNILDNLHKVEDGSFMGKKMATYKLPTRKIEILDDPLERAKHVNENRIKNNSKDISKKSKNMAKLYQFLAMYGMQPRENGDLPNEKELYQLIKDGKIKLSVEKVKKPESKLRAITHFKQIVRD